MSSTETAASALVDRWNRFRTNRNQALTAEHGWLALTSLQWLPPEPSTMELVPGLWSTDGTAATLTATEADGFTLVETGEPAVGTLAAVLENEASLMWVRHGNIVVELAVRGGRYALRTRDSQSPTLTGFSAVPTFGYRPDLVVQGRFEAYPEPRTVPIGTAYPQVASETSLVGDVVFELGGETYRLAAEEEQLGALVITFHDATNGSSTDEWRKVVTTRPRPDGTVVLDFNRAINYPSAFTDYGTCPMPVAGNRVAAAIEAGEKKPR
jgi:uncharacterized protein